METAALLTCVPMFGLLAVAAYTDLRWRRIPNWLTLSLAIGGVAQSFTAAATVPPTSALLGLLTGFGLTFVLFGLGGMGAGDVKLLAAVGAWLGVTAVLQVFAVEAVLGMLFALAQAAAQGKLRQLFRNSAVLAINLAHFRDAGLIEPAEGGQPGGGAQSTGGDGAGRQKLGGQTFVTVGPRIQWAVPLLIAMALWLGLNVARG